MKNFFLRGLFAIAALTGAAFLTACDDDDDTVNNIRLSRVEMDFDATETGTEKYVDVETDASSWRFTEGQPWIETRRDGDRLYVTVAENTTGAERIGYITFYAGDATDQMKVLQLAGFKYTITVEPTILELDAENPVAEWIDVTTTAPSWDVSSSQSWLKAEKRDGRVYVTAESNTGHEARAAVITVKADDANNADIAVSQAAAATHKITLSSISEAYTYNDTEEHTFTVTTNNVDDWSVRSTENWINVTKNEDGNGFTITLDENTGREGRSGSVIVTDDNNIADPQTLTITQAGRPLEVIDIAGTYSGTVNFDYSFLNDQGQRVTYSTSDDGSFRIVGDQIIVDRLPIEGLLDALHLGEDNDLLDLVNEEELRYTMTIGEPEVATSEVFTAPLDPHNIDLNFYLNPEQLLQRIIITVEDATKLNYNNETGDVTFRLVGTHLQMGIGDTATNQDITLNMDFSGNKN